MFPGPENRPAPGTQVKNPLIHFIQLATRIPDVRKR